MKTETQPAFVPSKRKYLFCGDHKGMKRLTPIIKKVMKENVSFEVVYLGEKEETNISRWLRNQRMGSFLYIAMEWGKLEGLKHLAVECGFSEEEVQLIGHGIRMIEVFCCKCHQKTKIEGLGKLETICSHCHLKLSISDHYSPLRGSFLGYATLEMGSGQR
ncbi:MULTISPECIES: dimethylamine monooxygenase subunit DmmA family protein [unclassified Rossellomorea]|uniref:dimethylamine monooxygenase subunit DmmA family protein n=1 Tax=unclassified Rossellomorea TaxID=2837526 RepID=UPI002624AB07|nr:dimethylamine monooxygenase subunit DmmA family protein [uncultured Rossellomorea sp.]